MFQRSRRLIYAVGLDCYNNVNSEKLPKLGATLSTSPVSRDAKSAYIVVNWTLLGFFGASSALFYWSRKNLWPNLEARYKKFPALKFPGSSLSPLNNAITLGIVSTVSCHDMGTSYEPLKRGWEPDMEYQTATQITENPIQITKDISSAPSINPGERPNRYKIGVTKMPISQPILDSIRHKVHDIPMDVQKGVFLNKVYPDSPASDAGLQTNDIIVKINGKPITSSNEVDDMVKKGEPFTVEVVRGREKLTITITPEALI